MVNPTKLSPEEREAARQVRAKHIESQFPTTNTPDPSDPANMDRAALQQALQALFRQGVEDTPTETLRYALMGARDHHAETGQHPFVSKANTFDADSYQAPQGDAGSDALVHDFDFQEVDLPEYLHDVTNGELRAELTARSEAGNTNDDYSPADAERRLAQNLPEERPERVEGTDVPAEPVSPSSGENGRAPVDAERQPEPQNPENTAKGEHFDPSKPGVSLPEGVTTNEAGAAQDEALARRDEVDGTNLLGGDATGAPAQGVQVGDGHVPGTPAVGSPAVTLPPADGSAPVEGVSDVRIDGNLQTDDRTAEERQRGEPLPEVANPNGEARPAGQGDATQGGAPAPVAETVAPAPGQSQAEGAQQTASAVKVAAPAKDPADMTVRELHEAIKLAGGTVAPSVTDKTKLRETLTAARGRSGAAAE